MSHTTRDIDVGTGQVVRVEFIGSRYHKSVGQIVSSDPTQALIGIQFDPGNTAYSSGFWLVAPTEQEVLDYFGKIVYHRHWPEYPRGRLMKVEWDATRREYLCLVDFRPEDYCMFPAKTLKPGSPLEQLAACADDS